MSDTRKVGDQATDSRIDNGPKVSEQTQSEVDGGMKAQSKSVSDYYQARKNGARDKDTKEILGKQPEFFDSAAEKLKTMLNDLPSDLITNGAVAKPDFTEIQRDNNGKITEITDANGKKTDIKYDKHGDPSEIKSDDGTWKKEANGWNEYDKNGKQIKHHDGLINVTQEGDIVAGGGKDGTFWRKNHDGSSSEQNPENKSIVTKDADGNPTEVIYPDGKRSTVTYDAHGKPLSIQMGEYNYVREDNKWVKHDKDGNTVKEMNGQLKVDKNGDISFVDKDLGTITTHRDGTVDRVRTDHSSMTTDINGNPTKIKYPDGNSNEITYDKSGEPVKIKGGAGDEWVKQGDHWSHKDSNGKEIDHLDGQIHVTKSGDIIGVGRDGTFLRQNHDGSFSESQKDKSIVTRDENDRVTEVIQPNGKKSEVTYDDLGRPVEVTVAGEGTYKKDGDGEWAKYDEKGNKIKDMPGEFEVSKDGDIVYKQDGASLTRHTDGSTERGREDGSKTLYDASGRPIKDTYPSGKSNEFHYDKNGNLDGIRDQDGNTWLKQGEHWNRFDKNNRQISQFDGTIQINKDGDLIGTRPDGLYYHRKNHDGTDVSLDDNGNQITRDESGKVIQVAAPNGKVTNYK